MRRWPYLLSWINTGVIRGILAGMLPKHAEAMCMNPITAEERYGNGWIKSYTMVVPR